MKSRTDAFGKTPLLAAVIVLCGLGLAGCDEHVEITRDTAIPVLKHQTWAWKPGPVRREGPNERPVVSRDVMTSRPPAGAAENPANETVRRELRSSIERKLAEKGLTQISDPAAADFLVDYKYAMRGRNVTVERVYPGAYPGLVCGPYGCWEGWRYGPSEVSYENVRFREGTFVFDMLQRASQRLAYRAWGVEPPYRTTISQHDVDNMVHALLKQLKPRG